MHTIKENPHHVSGGSGGGICITLCQIMRFYMLLCQTLRFIELTPMDVLSVRCSTAAPLCAKIKKKPLRSDAQGAHRQTEPLTHSTTGLLYGASANLPVRACFPRTEAESISPTMLLLERVCLRVSDDSSACSI